MFSVFFIFNMLIFLVEIFLKRFNLFNINLWELEVSFPLNLKFREQKIEIL